jgi:hypothetical protein
MTAVTVTAEIPAVTGADRHRGDASRQRPAPRRAAPYALRLTVWLLLFVLVVALAGAAVEHYHPTWLDSLRHHASPAPPRASAAPALRTLATSSSGASYAVPARTYTLVVTTSGYPCYVTIASPAGSRSYLFAETVLPSASPKSFAVTGSSSLVVGAKTARVAVEIGGRTVGTISAPVVGDTYSFEPTRT